jgi:hypothetical protein
MFVYIYAIGEGSSTKVDWLGFGPFDDDFTSTASWTPTCTILTGDGSQAIISENNPDSYYGNINQSITANLDITPYLNIKVNSTSAQYAIKVYDGIDTIDLQTDTSTEGMNTYNVKSITGWSGNKTFTVLISVIGEGSVTKMDWVRMSQHRVWWTPEASTVMDMTGTEGKVELNWLDATWGCIKQTAANINVDEYPYIEVNISNLEPFAKWTLEVDDGVTAKALQSECYKIGTYVYDYKTLAGWSGNKNVTVKVSVVAPSIGRSIYVDSVRFVKSN